MNLPEPDRTRRAPLLAPADFILSPWGLFASAIALYVVSRAAHGLPLLPEAYAMILPAWFVPYGVAVAGLGFLTGVGVGAWRTTNAFSALMLVGVLGMPWIFYAMMQMDVATFPALLRQVMGVVWAATPWALVADMWLDRCGPAQS
jgi:hypothetical protein